MNQPRFLTVALTCLLPLSAFAQDDGVVVQIATAQEQILSPETWVTGSVVSRFDAEVATEVAGTLIDVVEVGDRVRAGDTLGHIKDESRQIQLRNDEARIRRLQANIVFLERQLERFAELVASNSSAELEMDRVRMERDMAVQEAVAAQAQWEQTRYQIEHTRVQAPFDGVVAARMRQPGEFISAGQALVRLVNDAALEGRAQAPVSAVRFISPGAMVAVENDAFQGDAPIRAIVPVGDERSRMVELRIALESGDWIIGEALRASVPSAPPVQAITVPRDALVLRNNQVYVFKVQADGTAQRINVTTGAGSAAVISVRGALNGGDRVVVRGAERLESGQVVRVLAPFPEADPAASA